MQTLKNLKGILGTESSTRWQSRLNSSTLCLSVLVLSPMFVVPCNYFDSLPSACISGAGCSYGIQYRYYWTISGLNKRLGPSAFVAMNPGVVNLSVA